MFAVDIPDGREWASLPVNGLTKEVDVELYGTTRAATPGSLVVIRWAFNSYEDQDERVRLRLILPTGWTLLDPPIDGREMVLESWETLEGELRAQVPRDALPGARHTIRMVGEVVGEPGVAAVFSYVQVLRRGGLKPGAVGLSGVASLQATNVRIDGHGEPQRGAVLDVSGRVAAGTTLTVAYREGPRENNLTNYRVAQEATRYSGTLRNQSWQLQVGNQITSSGNAVTGPSVRGQGLSVRRTTGPLQGDLVLARPTTFGGNAGGHVVRGSVGWSGTRGRAYLTISDFGRPTGGYSTLPRYPEDIDPDSLERLERERKALQNAARNRVQGAGIDTELRLGSSHRIGLRGGWLRMHNATGDTIDEPTVEAQYGLTHRTATVNARWRHMPHSLRGVSLPGNEVALDGSVKVVGEWRLAGRAYRTLNETVGNSHRAETEGASLGMRYFRRGWRVDARGIWREWNYGQQPTVARTVNISFGMPVAGLMFSGYADVGEQDNGAVRRPTTSYRADLRWNGTRGSASWSASAYESLNSAQRLRTDVLGSLKLGEWEVAGGAWATRGWTTAADPGVWTQVGVPLTYDLHLTVGMEYAPPDYGRPPQWLGTFGVRKKVALPIPFLHDGSVSQSAQSGEGRQ